MDPIISLISLILAISLAGERLVTLVKTVFPALADDPNMIKSPRSNPERGRKSLIMLIAFLCCWLTAYLVKESITASQAPEFARLPSVFLGLLASGGSAFWTSLLGYSKAVRDIKIQQQQQEQISTEQKKSSSPVFQVQTRVNQAVNRMASLSAPLYSDTSTSIINRI